jgi:undecaprenyl-diphosphatase
VLFSGLDREAAARFAFLMATPITAIAAGYETTNMAFGTSRFEIAVGPLAIGMVASLISGFLAIAVLLRFLRSNSTQVFVAYRVVLALVVVVVWLGLGR